MESYRREGREASLLSLLEKASVVKQTERAEPLSDKSTCKLFMIVTEGLQIAVHAVDKKLSAAETLKAR